MVAEAFAARAAGAKKRACLVVVVVAALLTLVCVVIASQSGDVKSVVVAGVYDMGNGTVAIKTERLPSVPPSHL